VRIVKTFHGQLRLAIGGRSAPAHSWKSVLLTTQEQFDRFVGAINSTSYSKTSGKGGAPLAVPMKKAKPKWGKQAVLAVVCRSPFAKHQLQIERRAEGEYWALAGLKEKRELAAPSGLGCRRMHLRFGRRRVEDRDESPRQRRLSSRNAL
jgi:hypothetical protein